MSWVLKHASSFKLRRAVQDLRGSRVSARSACLPGLLWAAADEFSWDKICFSEYFDTRLQGVLRCS